MRMRLSSSRTCGEADASIPFGTVHDLRCDRHRKVGKEEDVDHLGAERCGSLPPAARAEAGWDGLRLRQRRLTLKGHSGTVSTQSLWHPPRHSEVSAPWRKAMI